MDNQDKSLEFDLEDILNEFHTEPEGSPEESVEAPAEAVSEEAPREAAPAEPAELSEDDFDEKLEQLLHMPELTITPVTVRTSQSPEPEETSDAPPMEDATLVFEPISEEASAEVETDLEDTISLPDQEPAAPTPPPAEPAFDVEETFAPPPIVFRPKSRLRELKKQLVAGPERRYYELSEKGVGKLQLALLANVVVTVLCAAVATMSALDMVPENRLKLVIFSQILAMMFSALFGSHLMVDSLSELLKGRFSVNTLLTITFAVCMFDGFLCLKDQRIPCCAAFSLEMTMALWARLQKRNTEIAQLDTMRKATQLNGIVKSENYFEGQDGILQTEGQVSDFMDNYAKAPTPEVAQGVYAFVSLLLCIGIAAFAGMLHGFTMGVQIFSTSLLVAVPASFFVSISRPMAILEARLHMVGTVLCGWEGVRDLCGKAVMPITDKDLFPLGSTKFNGVKFYGDRDPEEVVSYSYSLMAAAGGGLVPAFRQLLKSKGGSEYHVSQFQSYGDGGIGGEIRGESMLMGTLSFLQDMGVEIPEGTMVNQAIYTSIDGQLCAVYAISYAKMRSASAGLVSLNSYRKLTLLKMPGDFLLTEDFLHSKFGIRTNRIRFLTREEQMALAQYQPDSEEPVLAISTRDELVSTAYAITGARALRQSTRLGMAIHLIGGILGMVIMLVLGYLGSVELLTPTNVLLYQLIWAIPGLLVTEWTRTV